MEKHLYALLRGLFTCVCLLCTNLVRAQYNAFSNVSCLTQWSTCYLTPKGEVGKLSARRRSPEVEFAGRAYTRFVVSKQRPPQEDLYFYFRQEGGKVYQWSPEKSEEELVMDFDLNVGDIFTMLDGTRMQVEEAGDTCVFGQEDPHPYYKSKMLKLKSVNSPEKKDVWVEGIGSLYKGFLNMAKIDSVVDSRVYLLMSSYKYLHYYYAPILNKDYLKALWFETDTDKWLDYAHEDSLSYEFVEDTLHISGCLKLLGYYHYFSCIINNDNSIQLQWTDLPDMYDSYSPYPDIIDIKLPDFKPGIYSIAGTDIQLECKFAPSPYDLDGDGVLTLNDITTLINVYLECEP